MGEWRRGGRENECGGGRVNGVERVKGGGVEESVEEVEEV